MTLTEFLLARIAEDEAAVVRASEDFDLDMVRFGLKAAPDPARVLAECEAKRRIVDDLTPHDGADGRYDFGVTEWGVMRTLAAIYADHPDCREEWKP